MAVDDQVDVDDSYVSKMTVLMCHSDERCQSEKVHAYYLGVHYLQVAYSHWLVSLLSPEREPFVSPVPCP